MGTRAESDIKLYPKLSWLYHLTPDQLFHMSHSWFEEYVNAMPDILQLWQLLLINAAAFPYQDKRGMEDILNYWNPPSMEEYKESPKMNKDEYERTAASFGFKLIEEPATK